MDRRARHAEQVDALPYLLAAAAGEPDAAIAKRLSVNRNTVILWRKRFADEGIDGLWDIAPGRGRKPTYSIDKTAAVVDADAANQTGGDDALELPPHAGEPRRGQASPPSTTSGEPRIYSPIGAETFRLSRDRSTEKHHHCGSYLIRRSRRLTSARRKEPDSGFSPLAARVADQEGDVSALPRLQMQRHYHAVRRPGNVRWQGRGRVPCSGTTDPQGLYEDPGADINAEFPGGGSRCT